MTMSSLFAILGMCIALLAPQIASAQEAGGEDVTPEVAPDAGADATAEEAETVSDSEAAADATDSEEISLSDEEAQNLFGAARIAFADGRFEEARDHFRRAYELSRRPELLYNVAVAEDRLRNDAAALEAFEAFLEQVPDSEHRPSVERRLAILRAGLEEESRPVAPPPEGTSSSFPVWGVLTGALALALAGGAVAFGLVAQSKLDDLEAMACARTRTCSRQAIDDDGGPLFATLSTVAWITAGAFAALSVVAFTLELGADDSETMVSLGPAGMSIRRSF